MLILFTVTIFTGALLLFVVQPLVGRMLLPLLGGARENGSAKNGPLGLPHLLWE